MTIETDVFSRLTTFPGLTALVGTRCYPVRLPQNPILPAVSFFKVSNPRVFSHDGDSSLQHPRYQFSSWAETYAEAWAVAEQIRLAMQGEWGAGIGIYRNAVDLFDTEAEWYHIPVDIEIWHY